MSISAMTIAQVNAATPRLNGDATLTNLRNGERCTVRIVNPGGYHHSDFEPKERQDAQTLLRWSNGRWSWNWIPCTLQWGNNITACAVHTMPHAQHLYGRFSFNVMADPQLRLNAEGSHFCCHYENTRDTRWRTSQTNPAWWNQSPITVREALRLANNQPVPPQPQPTTPINPPTQYTVQKGDTLHRIATNHGIHITTLLALNPEITDPNKIRQGQIIRLSNTSPTQNAGVYTVVAGDTFNVIARNHNITPQQLLQANPQVTNPDIINIGDRLRIPN